MEPSVDEAAPIQDSSRAPTPSAKAVLEEESGGQKPDLAPSKPARICLDELILKAGGLPRLLSTLELHADHEPCAEALQELKDWYSWLFDKRKELASLPAREAVEKIRLWHRAFDYYLAADPEQSYPLATEPGKPIALENEEARRKLKDYLQNLQKEMRDTLRRRGIERIEAEEGSDMIAGVVEKSPQATEPTHNEELHNRVARLEPGQGGYRVEGRVFLVAYATCYEYVGPEGPG